MRRWRVPIAFFAGGICLGVLVGAVAARRWSRAPSEEVDSYELRAGGFRFINPLLECESTRDAPENRELSPFRSRVEGVILDLQRKGLSDAVSVYFRDLNNGPWFAVNDAEDFRPASLLKVPLLIAALRVAEVTPGFLNQRVVADLGGDVNQAEYFHPPAPLRLGKTYTVDELLASMISQSDNNATALIEGLLDRELVERVQRDLGIEPYWHKAKPGYVSTVGYATFLRVLYNASYLGREMSEKALSYLAASTFDRGLVAGVPRGVPVAHKFGEARTGESSFQLHDCGIVYHTGRTYLLCVMTRGGSLDRLAEAIASLSRAVYEEVSRQTTSASRP